VFIHWNLPGGAPARFDRVYIRVKIEDAIGATSLPPKTSEIHPIWNFLLSNHSEVWIMLSKVIVVE
jgi:hypothetical protein